MFTQIRRYIHFSICVAFLVALVLPAQAHAAKVIAIILADTDSHQGGGSFEIDFNNMVELAKNISYNTDLELVLKRYSGQKLTRDNVLRTIHELSVGSDDTLIVYFAGHGWNSGGTWPDLIFTRGEYDRSRWESVNFGEVIDTLKSQDPRLLIALADCCNNYIEEAPERRLKVNNSEPLSEAYEKLFVYARGYVLACGTRPGGYSFSTEHEGGVFTSNFLRKLYQELDSSDPSWRRIESSVLSYTTSYGKVYEQYPYYEISAGRVDEEQSTQYTSDDLAEKFAESLLKAFMDSYRERYGDE